MATCWLFLTGLSAPIEHIRREISALESEQAALDRQEEALTAKQDEMSRAIKRLKADSRGQFSPFGPRRLESALKNLRAVLDERDAIERRRTALKTRIEEAQSRLREAVRAELLQFASHDPATLDSIDRAEIRKLLAAYPAAPALPMLPSVSEHPPFAVLTDPKTLTEHTLLLRNERERHDVALRLAERVARLLDEQLSIYDALGGDDSTVEPQRELLMRQAAEATALIETLRQRLRLIDENLRQVDGRLSGAPGLP